MSITFALAREIDGVTHIGCPVCHIDAPCLVIDMGHLEDRDIFGWCDCASEAKEACSECQLEVNVSNANAASILERLGVEYDDFGSISASDLLGRAMVGNVGRDDSGIAASEDKGAGGAVLIDCGLRAGYFTDRLGALAELAQVAIDRGLGIAWG